MFNPAEIAKLLVDADEGDREILASARSHHGDVLGDQLQMLSSQARSAVATISQVLILTGRTTLTAQALEIMLDGLAKQMAMSIGIIALGYDDSDRDAIGGFAKTLVKRSVDLVTTLTRAAL